MSQLRRIIAALLLALWLPATLHCHFESAGVSELFACTGDHHDASCTDRGEPNRDACDVVETGSFRLAAHTAVAPAPLLCVDLLVFVPLLPALALTPPATGVSDVIASPPEVARTWHFTARAALPSRAPSLV